MFKNLDKKSALKLAAATLTTALLMTGITAAAEDYQDPAGRFTVPVSENWVQVMSETSHATYQLPNDLTMHILSVETDDVAIAEQSALRLADIDAAGLTSVDVMSFSGWNITFYVKTDKTGVTPMCRVNADVSHCLILTGDANLTRTPPGPVMTTIESFWLAGANTALPETVPEFEAMIENFVGEVPPGLSVVIAAGSDVIYAKGFGLADGPANMPAEEDTVFMWASMTKMVTATALMQLVDQGLVNLDAPVSDYLDYVPSEHGITVRQLLSHSSGLDDPQELILANISLKGQSIRDADAIARDYFEQFNDPLFEPGSISSYSTPGSVTQGQIVAQISGQTYADYVREHILTPLGMDNTDFFYSSDAMISNAAAPAVPVSQKNDLIAQFDRVRAQNDGGEFFREVDDTHAWLNHFRVFGAGSGLIGPATETIRFVLAHANGGEIDGVRILSPESVAAMQEMQLSTTQEKLYWGLGWEVSDAGEHAYVEHDGGGAGMYTKMRIYPESGVSIVLMSNAEGWNISNVADAAANVVFTMMAPDTTEATPVNQQQITDIPPIVDANGEIVPDGLALLEEVTLGGVDQWVLIRTQDVTNPVLLVLHGGPGGSQMPWVDLFQPAELEENFVVVHWDQRGAGKSFDADLSLDDLQPNMFVADTLELTDMLREKFNQDKIFLTGHSWGSALGFLTLMEDSEPFHAYIPSGERVNWVRSHEESLAWIKAQAEAANDTDVLGLIESITPFDATNPEHLGLVHQGVEIYRGGDIYTEGLWEDFLEYAIGGQSPYYTQTDVGNYIPGLEKSSAALENYVGSYDLFSSFPAATIPVHFIMGEHDHNTSASLAQEYFEFLKASEKSFTLIESAGHSFMYEKPHEWAAALIEIKNQTHGQ